MDVTERAVCIFPKDPEYQFAAAGALQSFVNGYAMRMRNNLVAPNGAVNFGIEYCVVVDDADWLRILESKLQLDTPPYRVGFVPPNFCADILLDFRDEMIQSFEGSSYKHLMQILGDHCGTQVHTLPRVRHVAFKADPVSFAVVGDGTLPLDFPHLSYGELARIGDAEITGVVGCAGIETYLAASMGLAVVEIIPEKRHSKFLSKWSNPLYRATRKPELRFIESAIADLTQVICSRATAA